MTQLLDIMDSVKLLKTIDTQVYFAYLADKYGAVNFLAIFSIYDMHKLDPGLSASQENEQDCGCSPDT